MNTRLSYGRCFSCIVSMYSLVPMTQPSPLPLHDWSHGNMHSALVQQWEVFGHGDNFPSQDGDFDLGILVADNKNFHRNEMFFELWKWETGRHGGNVTVYFSTTVLSTRKKRSLSFTVSASIPNNLWLVNVCAGSWSNLPSSSGDTILKYTMMISPTYTCIRSSQW